MREFFNVIDEPKLNTALNDDNDAPILDWILVPIVHIVCIYLSIDKSNNLTYNLKQDFFSINYPMRYVLNNTVVSESESR